MDTETKIETAPAVEKPEVKSSEEIAGVVIKEARQTIKNQERLIVELRERVAAAELKSEGEAKRRKMVEQELEKAGERASKDKEKLLRQIENFRAEIAGSKVVARALDNKLVVKYLDVSGRANELVPLEVRSSEDWIGLLIQSHIKYVERKSSGLWGDVLDAHIRAETKDLPPDCHCPVCALRKRLDYSAAELCVRESNWQGEITIRDKKIKELEAENRDHRRSKGPRSEKEKAAAVPVQPPTKKKK